MIYTVARLNVTWERKPRDADLDFEGFESVADVVYGRKRAICIYERGTKVLRDEVVLIPDSDSEGVRNDVERAN